MELWYIFITSYVVYQYGFGPFLLLLYFLLLSFILLLRDILFLSLPYVSSDSSIFFCFFVCLGPYNCCCCLNPKNIGIVSLPSLMGNYQKLYLHLCQDFWLNGCKIRS